MFSFIVWKHGEVVPSSHLIPDINAANIVFNNLLTTNSRVQLCINDKVIKDMVNPVYPNTLKAKPKVAK
jgi:hypothetical protein